MIRIIDVTYHTNQEYDQPQQVLQHQYHSLGYTKYLKEQAEIQVIKHLNFEGTLQVDGVQFSFFRGRNKFFHIPFKTHRYIKSQKPDVVLVQGFSFSVQVIFLRLLLGSTSKILAQHRADKPMKGIKGLFQKIAARCIDGYLFTSMAFAQEWKTRNLILPGKKYYEVLAGSTGMQKQDKEASKLLVGMKGARNFIWVGNLDTNKDPITTLLGFEQYANEYPDARLYMIYQQNDLMAKTDELIAESPALSAAVHLVGRLDNKDLAWWFSAADFYLSGSHKESCGFALIESMICGCIPVVTNIPSFKKITGDHGFLFTPGDTGELYRVLKKTEGISKNDTSAIIAAYAADNLSFKAIADSIFNTASDITGL